MPHHPPSNKHFYVTLLARPDKHHFTTTTTTTVNPVTTTTVTTKLARIRLAIPRPAEPSSKAPHRRCPAAILASLRVRLSLTQHQHYPTATMSTISLSDLQYMDRETLASSFSSPESPSQRQLPASTAVIDVRDSDHIGGHIRGSTWVPSSQLDYKMPELVRALHGKDTVVFHCALSQQRGPSAALRYLREKQRLQPHAAVESKGVVSEESRAVDSEEKEEDKEAEGSKKQKVFVLRGGFTMWQEKYGEDVELTEEYKKDIWEFGS